MTVTLSGTLDAASDPQTVRDALPEHIRLSRAEPGCLRFNVVERENGTFEVNEAFTDQAAFDAHQTRTRSSAWWRATSHMPRDFEVTTSGE